MSGIGIISIFCGELQSKERAHHIVMDRLPFQPQLPPDFGKTQAVQPMHSEDLPGAFRHGGQYSVDPPEFFPVQCNSFGVFSFISDVIQRVRIGDEVGSLCRFAVMVNDQVAGNAE